MRISDWSSDVCSSDLDADAAQLVDRMLGRLGLQLTGVADVRHKREVKEHAVATADIDRELTDRLQEGQGLDVADCAADLADHEIDGVGLADDRDAVLAQIGRASSRERVCQSV